MAFQVRKPGESLAFNDLLFLPLLVEATPCLPVSLNSMPGDFRAAD
jgi:hypothetical protein